MIAVDWVERGCVDQVFVIRQVVEKTIEKDKRVYMAFVHLESHTYNSVSRDKLSKVLEEYELRGILLRAIQALYDSGMVCVKVGE